MGFINCYYKNNPLHMYSYEVDGKKLKVVFINIHDRFINSVVINYQEHYYNLEPNSSQQVFEYEIELKERKPYTELPSFVEAIIDGEKVSFTYEDLQYLLIPKSINNMRDEKYLYIQKMVKYNGCEKKNVRCSLEQFEDYWHCTCGGLNFNNQKACMKCGVEKEKLFSHKVDNGAEEFQSRKILKSNEFTSIKT